MKNEVNGNKPRSSNEARWGDEPSPIIVIMGLALKFPRSDDADPFPPFPPWPPVEWNSSHDVSFLYMSVTTSITRGVHVGGEAPILYSSQGVVE